MQNVIGTCNQNTVLEVANDLNFIIPCEFQQFCCGKKNINVPENPAPAPQSLKHSNSKAIKIKLNNLFLLHYSIVEGFYYLLNAYSIIGIKIEIGIS